MARCRIPLLEVSVALTGERQRPPVYASKYRITSGYAVEHWFELSVPDSLLKSRIGDVDYHIAEGPGSVAIG